VLFSFIYQIRKIYPYTLLAKKEVKPYLGEDSANAISLLVSNVCTPNRHTEKLVALVNTYQPHLLLTLETDQWWEDRLAVLEELYPYQVKIPLDNLYGMHLYSKFKLENTKVLYIVEKDIPSIHSEVILPSAERISIHCLHPEPPSPTESDTSTARDAELLIVGKNVAEERMPVLVFGDLNDVAWSRTTRLFQKISGLLDPRKGRGFFNTFHARYPLFRWPLDHIFHSQEFLLRSIKRLPSIDSDHFPIYIDLQLCPDVRQENDEAELEEEEEEWTEEKIEKADANLLSL
jgi:endonuclease/exonuclease/phosphatase (EEP) superfamily protein YafD